MTASPPALLPMLEPEPTSHTRAALTGNFFDEYRRLRPRAPMPQFDVSFYPFTGVNTTIRLRDGKAFVRLSDMLEGAPDSVTRAIAHILLAKLYRKPIEPVHANRYRRHLGSEAVIRQAELVRRSRGRKNVSTAQGHYYDLDEVFDHLNRRFFQRAAGPPSADMERALSAAATGPLRRGSQYHCRQPRIRPAGDASLRGRVSGISRDAAFETSCPNARRTAVRPFARIPAGRKNVSATGAGEGISEEAVNAGDRRKMGKKVVPPSCGARRWEAGYVETVWVPSCACEPV